MSKTPSPPPIPPGVPSSVPPFGAVPPPPPVSRQQRREALRVARRQQRLARASQKVARPVSSFGPALLIGLGVWLLLIQLGRTSWTSAIVLFTAWWPLLLIAAGAVLLGEWLYDSRRSLNPAGVEGIVLPRRIGVLGALMLALILALGGVTGFAGRFVSFPAETWLSGTFNHFAIERLLGKPMELEVHLGAPLASGSLLTVENGRGDVSITGSSQDGKVHVVAHQRVWSLQNMGIRSEHSQPRPVLEVADTGLLLHVSEDDRDETDLAIEVPHETSLSIVGEQGTVVVRELHGNTVVRDHSGSVTLTAITGDITLGMQDENGNIAGHSLTGAVRLSGRAGDLSFTDVTGPVTVHGDFFGTTRLERVQGATEFKSSFTDLHCEAIPGELTIEGRSELEADGIAGPVLVKTSDREITLSHLTQGATIEDKNGSVTLGLLTPMAPVSVNTTDGTIEVSVPSRSSLNVHAETSDGDIENQLGLRPQQTAGRVVLHGKYRNGGTGLSLQTSVGDVKIHLTDGAIEPLQQDRAASEDDNR